MASFFSTHPFFRFLFHFLLLTFGSVLYAVGVGVFIDPLDLAPGGLTGVGVLLEEYTSLGAGTYLMIFNIPLLIIGVCRFKFPFFISTLYSTSVVSLLINAFQWPKFPYYIAAPITEDLFLSAVSGGALIALGMGLVFHGGGCTGGIDIAVKLLRQKFKEIKSGAIFFSFDFLVVVASFFVFDKLPSAFYSLVSIFVTSVVLDYVLYGPDGCKVIYVMTDHPEEIAHRLMQDVRCGVTYLEGQGAYSGKDRKVVMCAFHKHLYSRVRDAVNAEDPRAFMIVTSSHEILGEGFKNPFADEM